MIRDTDSGLSRDTNECMCLEFKHSFFIVFFAFHFFSLSFILSNHVSDAHTICFILFQYENFSIFFLSKTITQQH